ncbi:hypothetical protein [Cobetia crustatorum]|uniref:hypothetical protein n=1 Tax=Cobetia crustatorum TaxID=553385 RepID=UPI002009E956|nr:hypothetical protein [Cobetia crustatorum]
MADISWLDSLLESFEVSLDQNERLLTLEMSGADFIPHRLVAEERVSRPFAYTLDCISQNGDIELKTLMAQRRHSRCVRLMAATASFRGWSSPPHCLARTAVSSITS